MAASLPCLVAAVSVLTTLIGLACAEDPTLIVQGKHGIYHLDTNGKLLNYRNESLRSYQRHTAMNPLNGTVCWVSLPEEYAETGVVRCALVNDLDTSWVLPPPDHFRVRFTEALEMDPVTANIYLTVSGRSYACSANFKRCAKVTEMSDSAYLLTAYDMPNRLMFQISVHDYTAEPKREWWQLDVVKLDGSERRKLADNSTLRFPTALAVDSAKKLLYVLDTPDALWVDLNRFDYDGQRLETVARFPRPYKASRLRSLQVVGDSAFVVWKNQQNISRVDLNTGNVTHIVQGNITDGVTEIIFAKKQLRSVNVYSKDLQPLVENSCLRSRGGCGDICVPTITNGAPTHTCICPPGQELVDTECFDREHAFIIVVHPEALYAVEIATGDAFKILSGLRNATKVDFFYKDKLDYVLYWIDDGGLFRGDWRAEGQVEHIETLVPSGGKSRVVDVVVDWYQKNVLWMEHDTEPVDEDHGWAMKVASIYGDAKKTIVQGPWLDQSAMFVDTDGLTVVCQADVNDTTRVFSGWDMNGVNKTIQFAFDFDTFKLSYKVREYVAELSAIDDFRDNRYLWVEPTTSTIQVTISEYSPIVMNRTTLLQHDSLKNAAGMDAFHDQIFWVDGSSGVLMTADGKTGSDIKPFQISNQDVLDSLKEVHSIKVLHPRKQPVSRFGEYCDMNKNGCSDICVKVFDDSLRQAACACADGKELADDEKTCE